MASSSYRYTIDYFTPAGERLGSVPVQPDWEPALEWTQFLGVRRQSLNAIAPNGSGQIDPVWDSDHGKPVLRAARVWFPARDSHDEVSAHIPITYFKKLAQEGSSVLVKSGQLQAGDPFRYKVCAYPVSSEDRDSETTTSETLFVEQIGQELPLDDQPLERFLANSTPYAVDAEADDVHVFIPHRVVAESVTIASEIRTVETGGVLVGKLHRAESSRDVFVEVSAQVPALHTTSSAATLTFTPETWSAVRTAIALRKQNEIMLGWWHFHPNFCQDCPPERKKLCVASRSFFSSDDCHFHRTVFPRAYQLGLLISDHGKPEFEMTLFGWRHGLIESRGFHVLKAPRPPTSPRRNAHATQ